MANTPQSENPSSRVLPSLLVEDFSASYNERSCLPSDYTLSIAATTIRIPTFQQIRAGFVNEILLLLSRHDLQLLKTDLTAFSLLVFAPRNACAL